MKVRRGFHRLGIVGFVPLAVAAGCALLFAAYMVSTGGYNAVYAVTGPDGKRWEYPTDPTGYLSASDMERELTRRYGRPISFGSGEVAWPTRTPARREARVPALAGLAILALGGVWYGICWVLGWVVAGFLDDAK